MNTLAEDVDRENLFFALRSDHDFPFFWKALSGLHVEFVLVTKAAHESAACTRDLSRIERETLFLCNTKIHGAQLGQP